MGVGSASYFVTFCILCAVPVIASATVPFLVQTEDEKSRPGDRIEFDIPAQPLGAALSAYGVATGIQLFVDAELTAGRRSTALKGAFSLEAALKNLLAGTGLEARAIGDQGFTFVSSLPSTGIGSDAVPDAISPTVVRFTRYSAAIQDAVRSAICHHDETRSGSYRALVRLWIGASGGVTGTELVTSTGDRSRDAVLSGVFQGLTVGMSPPANLPQPVTLLVATANRPAGYCPGDGQGLSHPDPGREHAP